MEYCTQVLSTFTFIRTNLVIDIHVSIIFSSLTVLDEKATKYVQGPREGKHTNIIWKTSRHPVHWHTAVLKQLEKRTKARIKLL